MTSQKIGFGLNMIILLNQIKKTEKVATATESVNVTEKKFNKTAT